MSEKCTVEVPGRCTWAAGIVNHGSYEALSCCLESLRRQSWPPTRIMVWDTGQDTSQLEQLVAEFPDVVFRSGPNLGYAGGANRVVDSLRSLAEFVLLLNPDVALCADFVEHLINSAYTALP